jgi:hypothetical protein
MVYAPIRTFLQRGDDSLLRLHIQKFHVISVINNPDSLFGVCAREEETKLINQSV